MSEVKVNKLSPRSGTTVTIGDSGDTINIVGTLQNNGSPLAGDISSVVAGTGLSGGATSGVATLNIEAAQPTITSLGTITGFTSTGIDDNADATAITINSSEQVAIGTTSPTTGANLTLSGQGFLTSGADSGSIAFGSNASYQGRIYQDNSGSDFYIENTYSSNNGDIIVKTNGSERLRVKGSGEIGIGETAPFANVHVKVSDSGVTSLNSAASGLFIESANSTGMTIASGTTNVGRLVFADSGNNLISYVQYDHSNNAMSFQTNGSEKMRINSSGNVGIGETAPLGKLHVKTADSGVTTPDAGADDLIIESSTDTGMSFLSTDTATIRFNDANGAGDGSYQYRHDDRSTRIVSAGSERMRIDSSGSVGISNTTPGDFHSSGNDLVVGNTTGGHGLTIVASTNDAGSINFGDATNASTRGKITYEHSNDSLAFHAGAAEKFRVGANGNFSIGTTADSARLNVNTSNSGVTPNSLADDLFVESSGHTGITIGSGSSHLSSIYFANSSDNDIGKIEVDHAAGQMRFHNNTSERARFDASGNFGIGTSSPTLPLEVSGSGLFGGSVIATGSTTTTASRRAIMTHDGSSMIFKASGDSTNRQIIFEVSGDGTSDEKLRIGTSGRFHTNTSTSPNGHLNLIGERGGSYRAIVFEHTGGGGQVGNITTGSSSVSYNTSSDYRLKESIVAMENATTRLKQLQPKRFNFKSDADKTVDGFLAHEVQNIVPEAISGTKDAVQVWEEGEELPEGVSVGDNKLDENGNTIPEYQGIDQAKLVPLLVKTIQELEARITTLENA